ncbi:MAG: ATP-dependent helicase HrpB [Cyclobacteriaceae bacterium]|nr:ATP-dependent helicase HrpB [Cyclobacteriaceae bacterium]MCH8517733.1 ATP-dependent helicase HrpB [Cyclobacteriaceae bacterium]
MLKNLPHFPITEVIAEICGHFENHSGLVLHAPPGAGKSTLLPLYLLEHAESLGGKILLLEPRRLAAKGIASRLAELINEPVGQRIGYQIRFDRKISNQTQIEVITEGILTQRLQSDSALEGISYVIFDEFHERSIHTDLALSLCLEVQKVLRPDLRILIMSATLDSESLSNKLGYQLIRSLGRQYPIEIIYDNDQKVHDPYQLGERVASKLVKICKEIHSTNILVFLPGQGEIMQCLKSASHHLPDYQFFPLYGSLPYSQQRRAIIPSSPNEKNRIILATNIAETSLTIEGIDVVVDSGFSREAVFDSSSGFTRLETMPITRDRADQRAGRAGRLGPGRAYRLWSRATDAQLIEHQEAEVLRSDLASLVLSLALWGISDPEESFWPDPLPKKHFFDAVQLLEDLEALEESKITTHGKELAKIPAHPRIAHLLIKADEIGLGHLAADLAALLEEKDPLDQKAGIDISLRVDALQRARYSKSQGKWTNLLKLADQHLKNLGLEKQKYNAAPQEIGCLLSYAYPERIASARPGNQATFQLSNGEIAQMHYQEPMADEAWIVVSNLQQSGKMAKIRLAAPLDPTDLKDRVKIKRKIEWDKKLDKLTARKEWRIGGLILQSVNIKEIEIEEKTAALLEAIEKYGENLLDFSGKTAQLQNRVASLKTWFPSEYEWPNLNSDALIKSAASWLSPYLLDCNTKEDLKALPLHEIIWHSLSITAQENIERLAPATIKVPSGSEIMINYQNDGEKPRLSVRIQELFGMLEIPKIADGKISLLIELLSPAFKPVQLTQDLESFWTNTYFELRKELKRKYPKHDWPENPLEAQAIRGPKKKK